MTTLHNFSEGELCPLTLDVGCQGLASTVAKATVTDEASVTSRGCDHCRFHQYVQVTDSCWLWTGSVYTHKGKRTYGQFYMDGRKIGAHVATVLLHHGPIEAGLEAMHSCNVKACVSPFHVSAGTKSQNRLDAFRDNPGVCAGENNGRARLTWADVHAIRAAQAVGARQVDLANKYGVHQVQVSHIVRGTRWPESKCPVHGELAAAVA